jgi:hypothetical protein
MCRPSAAEVGRRAVTAPKRHREGDGRGRAHPAAVELRGACFPAAACTRLIYGLAACTRIYQPRIDQDGDKFPEAKMKCARRPISQAGHADDESCHHPRARGTGDVSRLSSHRVEQTQYPGQRCWDSRPQSRIWWSGTLIAPLVPWCRRRLINAAQAWLLLASQLQPVEVSNIEHVVPAVGAVFRHCSGEWPPGVVRWPPSARRGPGLLPFCRRGHAGRSSYRYAGGVGC